MTEKKIKGIGGWLIFPIFAFALNIFVLGYDIIISITNTNIYLIIIIIILDGIGIFLFGNALSLIFHERKEAPIWAIAAMAYSVVLSILLAIIVKELAYISQAGQQFIWASIWTWYFLESKRVKNTFIK